jgi:hypothetical protein
MIPTLIALIMCSAAFAAWVWYCDRLGRARPARHRRDPFATPADHDDPDGDAYMAQLTGNWDPAHPALDAIRADLRALPALHDGTGRRSPELAALTRTLSGTGWLAALPDDDPLETTGTQPVAVCELGMPTEAYIEELYAEAEAELNR